MSPTINTTLTGLSLPTTHSFLLLISAGHRNELPLENPHLQKHRKHHNQGIRWEELLSHWITTTYSCPDSSHSSFNQSSIPVTRQHAPQVESEYALLGNSKKPSCTGKISIILLFYRLLHLLLHPSTPSHVVFSTLLLSSIHSHQILLCEPRNRSTLLILDCLRSFDLATP